MGSSQLRQEPFEAHGSGAMILSDREIQAALAREALVISPMPPAWAWSSTAVDLTLDKELRKWKSPADESVDAVVCPGKPSFNYSALVLKHSEIIDITNSHYDLEPKKFILGWTAERIKLPHRRTRGGKKQPVAPRSRRSRHRADDPCRRRIRCE